MKHYNHAYTIAFEVESDDPEHCTFEEYVEGLVKRVSDLKELRHAWDCDAPYDTYGQDVPPHVGFGNDEIDAAPALGDTIRCKLCGGEHPVEFGERVLEDGKRVPSKLLAFFKCGGKDYLCGINGKDVRR